MEIPLSFIEWEQLVKDNLVGSFSSLRLQNDFGLCEIASILGKQAALSVYWAGSVKENEGDINGGILLYKQAFRMWPALDSITDGGLPRGVREEAMKAGLACKLLHVINVADARVSKVMYSSNLLNLSDIILVDELRNKVLSNETLLINNSQNKAHLNKTCVFLNSSPDFMAQKDITNIIAKMLHFGVHAWLEANWSGDSINPGVLCGIPGGFTSLSIRVVEYWKYDIGGGLVDPLHYDVDSVITLIALLHNEDLEGGVVRTNEIDGTQLEHDMKPGDVICFLSHKYHNITPVTKGLRCSLVIEMWQGGIGHEGR